MPTFGTDPVQICLGWGDEVSVTGEQSDGSGSGDAEGLDLDRLVGVGRTGIQRFDAEDVPGIEWDGTFKGFGVSGKRSLSGFMIIASALFAIVTDIYSEKNWVGMVTMFVSSMTGMIAMASWVAFQATFSNRGDSTGVTFDEGGWALVGAWVGAFVAWLGYVFSYRERGDYKPREEMRMERRGSQQTHV